MIVEGSGTAEGPAGGAEGPPRRSEGDLLAERRARRAAESGQDALTRRAEAAEATVQTLERHVASLQQRLHEADEERREASGLFEGEREAARERERELRRAKQREYAEQQLRVEAEDRLVIESAESVRRDAERRTEIEHLGERASVAEREVRVLTPQVERLRRQLAEAEQAAAAERATLQRATDELQGRVGELERRTDGLEGNLQQERSARQRIELLLGDLRAQHRRLEPLVGDMRALVARLLEALAAPEPRPPAAPTPPDPQLAESGSDTERAREMVDALGAAVERLRQRAEATPLPVEPTSLSRPRRVPHKHALSLIARWKLRRKQRREG